MDELNLAELCRKTAIAVHEQHNRLGSAGTKVVGRNRFGDPSLYADVAAEKRILDIMRNMGLRARVIAEEHGRHTIGFGDPQFTIVMDGLDGSTVYAASSPEGRASGAARYGTMFAIYPGENFRYGDVLVSCLMEHPTKRLFLATPVGTRMERIGEGYEQPISILPKPLVAGSVIHCDSEDPTWGALLREQVVRPLHEAGFTTRTTTSATSRQYVDVLTGASVATIQWTRKGNLELAAAHQLITGAGGAVMHLNGSEITDHYYDEFGQDPDNVEFFIAACTRRVAEELVRNIVYYR